MKSLDEVLREKAGLTKPRDKAPLKDVEKAKLPDDSNTRRTLDIDIRRPIDARVKVPINEPILPGEPGKHSDIEINRPGSKGTTEEIDIIRGGESGKTESIVITRGGTLGGTEKIDIERPGDSGHTEDINIIRGGDLGHTEEVIVQRPKWDGIISDIEVIRGGNPGKTSEIDIVRPGQGGTTEDVDVERGGEVGKTIDVEANRPTQEEIKLTLERAGIPYDTNFFSLNEKNPYFKTQDVLERINSISSQVQGWLRTFGVNVPDITQVNTLLKLITQGRGVEVITGFNANNEDLLAYFKFLMLNGTNLARIPIDLALRYAAIPAMQETKSKIRDLVIEGIDKRAESKEESIKDLAGYNSEERKDYKESNKGASEFLGYYVDGGKLVQCTILISRFLKNLDSSNFTTLYPRPRTNEGGKFKGDSGADYVTTRQKISDMTLASNHWWSVSIRRFISNEFGNTLLPEFPKPFRNGWLPVTSISFTKGDLKKKSFEFPFFNLEIPVSNERPRDLKIELVDNETHDIRYWLDSYVRNCFDIDKNIIVPYKNICLDITIFQLDCTLQTIYKKNFIALISEFNSTFEGSESFRLDEISLGLEIVGEYDENESEVNFEFSSVSTQR